ncbi:MAG TPA: MFS transporter [Isosphaeraceae bacterium]|jgi:ACS family tartrate transporter-like MFS transporter|nr:MFS transporter [Isosphaeraceae bacterium]
MSTAAPDALDRARRKAYVRLLPILFACYVIAYVDRANVALAKLTMVRDLPGFNNAIIGFGAGMFFIGYFLLEIPGTLLVEKWSARKWISRIMISWGIVAALTAFIGWRVPLVADAAEWAYRLVHRPFNLAEFQFYAVRFLLGLAEAGFFPGVIVYLTHWFPSRDRARALSWFLIATPIAQIVSPKPTNWLLRIGTDETIKGVVVHHPEVLGLEGWQWVYIAWGIPAVLLGFVVLFFLTDRPGHAGWLEADERDALELELKREKALHGASRHMKVTEAFRNPKVLLLAAAYFFIVTGNYGVEFFMPSILERWYNLKLDDLTWLVIIPPMGSLVGQLFIGWSSDRTKERRLHASVPIYFGAAALAATLLSRGNLWLTVALFTVALAGLKAYLPAFWSLPSLFLTEAAAAGSIGLINSVGNLGGQVGPTVIGTVETVTGSFRGGILFLATSMAISATIIILLGLGRRVAKPEPSADPLAEALIEPA